jgi:hypothetical protein
MKETEMNSRFRNAILVSLGALVVATAAGTAVVASFDDDDGSRQTIDAPAGACLDGAVACDDVPDGAAGGACLEGAIECGDIPVDGGAAAGGTCLEGATECDDIPVESGAGTAGMCLAGVPECNDTPGLIREDVTG